MSSINETVQALGLPYDYNIDKLEIVENDYRTIYSFIAYHSKVNKIIFFLTEEITEPKQLQLIKNLVDRCGYIRGVTSTFKHQGKILNYNSLIVETVPIFENINKVKAQILEQSILIGAIKYVNHEEAEELSNNLDYFLNMVKTLGRTINNLRGQLNLIDSDKYQVLNKIDRYNIRVQETKKTTSNIEKKEERKLLLIDKLGKCEELYSKIVGAMSINSVHKHYRTILDLYYIRGLEIKDIAKRLSLKYNTVRKIKGRAERNFLSFLKANQINFENARSILSVENSKT